MRQSRGLRVYFFPVADKARSFRWGAWKFERVQGILIMAQPNDEFARNAGDSPENMPALRARVPEHVARGEISTGVIVVTGSTEFLLDFVRNLPRPNAVVSRVVLPHTVMPQFIEALSKNIELYRQRYGELPGMPSAQPPSAMQLGTAAGAPSELQNQVQHAGSANADGVQAEGNRDGNLGGTGNSGTGQSSGASPASGANAASVPPKKHNPQDIYDELKLRDEILSGAYANAVMIGHGPYEFSFDFITNFYPQSAVSARVYLACGHIPRMLDSLRQSWEQLRPRLGYPPSPPSPPAPPS